MGTFIICSVLPDLVPADSCKFLSRGSSFVIFFVVSDFVVSDSSCCPSPHIAETCKNEAQKKELTELTEYGKFRYKFVAKFAFVTQISPLVVL